MATPNTVRINIINTYSAIKDENNLTYTTNKNIIYVITIHPNKEHLTILLNPLV